MAVYSCGWHKAKRPSGLRYFIVVETRASALARVFVPEAGILQIAFLDLKFRIILDAFVAVVAVGAKEDHADRRTTQACVSCQLCFGIKSVFGSSVARTKDCAALQQRDTAGEHQCFPQSHW